MCSSPPPAGERIARFMARAGLCSRREAERWIAAGRVRVNGTALASPACVVSARDRVEVDGTPVSAAAPLRLWLYHKPAGLLTTHSDPQGRPTVFENLPPGLPRVVSVGRLDLTSEGLLLLTTSGAVARHLELPSTGWKRGYRVRIFGKPEERALETLRRGVTVEGVRYAPAEITRERETASHSWISVHLREGKNREIRRMFESLGFRVTRLIRVSYGAFQLGKLPPGEVKEVPAATLRRVLGEGF
jgi:23S rRNA pseudouridine2605 synthase